MIILFYYTSADTLEAIKRESSYLAERRFNEAGDSLFDELVYDEEYESLFRDHFMDARARVIEATLAYSKNLDESADFFETENLDHDKDFVLFLMFPDEFPQGMIKPITVKIREFLVGYIMYRWLETKLPQEAAVFLQRAENALESAKASCERRIKVKRRVGRLF